MNETKSNINDLLSSQPVKEAKEPKYINKANPSKTITFRLKEKDVDALTKHFKLKGIVNLSTGIRQVIYSYMEKENIL